MARGTPGAGRIQALAGLAVAAPLLVLVAALGTRVGAWPVEIGYDLLTMRAGVSTSIWRVSTSDAMPR